MVLVPHIFEDNVRAAVLHHMNDDHQDDNLLITRAFGGAGATKVDVAAAEMTGFDGDGGDWTITCADGTVSEARIPWPIGSISERIEVRQQIVQLYDDACAALGVEPRPHE